MLVLGHILHRSSDAPLGASIPRRIQALLARCRIEVHTDDVIFGRPEGTSVCTVCRSGIPTGAIRAFAGGHHVCGSCVVAHLHGLH